MLLKATTSTTLLAKSTTSVTREVVHPDNATSSSFNLSYIPLITIVDPGSTSTVSIDDAEYTRNTDSTTRTEATLTIIAVGEAQTYEYESLTPLIGTIDSETLEVSWVSNGNCIIQVTNNFGLVKTISIPVSQTSPITTDVLTGFVSGSFGKACSDPVDTRISGLTASTTTKNRYTTGTTPNPSNFISDADWTGVSFAPTGSTWRVTLISPIHGICATHAAPAIGATYYFKGGDGTVNARTVDSKVALGAVGPGVGYEFDFTIIKFSSALPANVKFYKMLPTDWKNYAPGYTNGIPAIGFNGERNFVSELYADIDGGGQHHFYFKRSSLSAKRAEFWEQFANSSNPIFFIPDVSDPILLTTESTNNSAGPNSVALRSNINAAMTTLGGGYQVTDFDMSSYNEY